MTLDGGAACVDLCDVAEGEGRGRRVGSTYDDRSTVWCYGTLDTGGDHTMVI